MGATTAKSSQGSTVVGAIVAVLIIGAVATLGYYQFEVAGKQTTTTTTSQGPTCPSAACRNVTIPSGAGLPPQGWSTGQKTTYGYTPDVITVVIGKNNTVFWTNSDSAAHTVTSDSAGVFDSGTLNPGGTFQWTFTAPGTFTYHCSFHPWMQGTIVVKA